MMRSLKILVPAGILATATLLQAQQTTVPERVVALKASLAASEAILKRYEWVETTAVSIKGEEKSRQMNRCYHGADGAVQKVPLTQSAPAAKKRGLRGRIAASKQEEMTDYMKQAVSLAKAYMPLNPLLIQKAKDSGNVSVQPVSGKRAQLTFSNYLKAGDRLALEVDLNSNRLLSATVATYIDSPDDSVTANVRFSTLENSASYPSNIKLDAKAKKLTVNVENSGYRIAGS